MTIKIDVILFFNSCFSATASKKLMSYNLNKLGHFSSCITCIFQDNTGYKIFIVFL